MNKTLKRIALMYTVLFIALSAVLMLPTATTRKHTPEPIRGTQNDAGELQTVELIPDSEFELLARVVCAEAGNQGYQGQRLVASVILNRVKSDKFKGNTITEIVYEKSQFSSVWDGGINRHKPTEETYKACRDEIENPSNNGFLFFRTGHGHKENAYQYKDHFFNK